VRGGGASDPPNCAAIYRGVVAVTREADGSLALAGGGTPVDWVVEMHRFDQGALVDRLARAGALTIDLMSALGAEVARFHRRTEERRDHGGEAGMRWVIDGNAVGFAEFGAQMFP
jgi:aminoglycoside phosphotransferase family enzyme